MTFTLLKGEDKQRENDYDQAMFNCAEVIDSTPTESAHSTTRLVCSPARAIRFTRGLGLCLALLLTGGCAPVKSSTGDAVPHRPGQASKQTETSIGETPVLDLKAFTTVEQLIPALAEKRVVFVGEHHHRYDHHLIQLEIIRRLHEKDPRLAIGMEMFQQPFQRYLDDYVSGAISEQEMLRVTEYFQRWRMDYRLYAPILRYAREHRLPVIALNLPQELTRKVGRVGIDGLVEEERTRLPAEIDRSDTAYEKRIKQVFESHPNENGQKFEHFLEVQLLWDEGMADRAAAYLQDNPDYRMVVVAGSGHVAYGSAIPQRLKRRVDTDIATILNSWEGPIEPGLADYLLLPEQRRLPPAGKMGAVLEEEDDLLKVAKCLDDSPCAAVGIKAGDRILSIENETIGSLADLRLALWYKQPGDTISIDVFRERWLSPGKTLSYEITLK